MSNSYSSLRECDGKSKDGANAKQLLLFTHILRLRRAVLLSDLRVHFLPCGKKRTKKTRGGYAPQPRAAVGGATVRLANEARLKGLGKCKVPHLVDGCRPRWSWASEAMPKTSKLTPHISKKGEYGAKPFAKRQRDSQRTLVGGESLDFPTRQIDSEGHFRNRGKMLINIFASGRKYR